MTTTLYPKAKQKLIEADLDLSTLTLKAALLGAGYSYDAAHEFLDDLAANRVGVDQTLTSVTTTDGVFDAANAVFPAVASGTNVAALVIYADTGVAGTSPLIIFMDEGPGLPFITNGAVMNVNWSNGAYKIFSL